MVKARMESDLQRKEGIGGHTMSSWWLGIPDLGGRLQLLQLGSLSCPDAPLWNSSHSLCARDYDWGQHLLCLVISPDKYAGTYMSTFGEEIGVNE